MGFLIKWKKSKNNKEMNLTGHLTELRNRIIATLVLFFLFFMLGFAFVKDIYTFFINDIDIDLMVISPTEIIWIYFQMAGVVAITGTIPVLAYQTWAFIRPGLTSYERRVSLSYIPFIFVLFIIGLVFGYEIFVQFVFPFILTLSEGMFDVLITVDRYFKFLFQTIIPFALLFELPIAAMFLTTLGIITPDYMSRIRKFAYLALIIISTMLTPPDLLMPLLVSFPFILLYEVSIQLSKVVYRKKLKKYEEFMRQENAV
ncbi:twin-arginine translocase subunit TatC [Virgibacillus dakarensis]|uniref:twin-arginine translocase subunit TatC n=1 Tax=Virgibacillus dakarensis TaxID=1917889 RepID=UPI000B4517CF|nr:twin-arginine translocase subunit TatC [Virgibacillus dakarensis]MBT2215480.1 twin-arginine translocase subunit TatC [Virgibacillus dakarensis]MTW86232.1 twin-arginine translocase subunit TatC [Virgibacillus dakarensis]